MPAWDGMSVRLPSVDELAGALAKVDGPECRGFTRLTYHEIAREVIGHLAEGQPAQELAEHAESPEPVLPRLAELSIWHAARMNEITAQKAERQRYVSQAFQSSVVSQSMMANREVERYAERDRAAADGEFRARLSDILRGEG